MNTFNIDGGNTLDRKGAYKLLMKEGIYWALNSKDYKFWGVLVVEKATGKFIYETSNIHVSEKRAVKKATEMLHGMGLNVNDFTFVTKFQILDLNDAISVDRNRWY